uniref:Uncharacterized protein n=1 Tax=Anguilla anguilla TaxID=7936 RepID=A0A0E9T2J6_ANGAN
MSVNYHACGNREESCRSVSLRPPGLDRVPHQLSSENSAISRTNMQEYCMALVCVCTCAFVCARVCIVCVCVFVCVSVSAYVCK